MLTTYHNHTLWSDGRATLADMVAGARRLGVAELGVSDHLVIHPSGSPPQWSMDPARFPDYVACVLDAATGADPVLRLGVEADWFADTEAELADVLAAFPLDYVIGAVHEVDGFTLDADPAPWDELGEADRNDLHRAYWQRVRGLAASNLFDVVAHLDLPKKFGHRATTDLGADIQAALDAIAAAGLVVELNTSGMFLPCAEPYPGVDLLRECRRRGLAVTLSADAHRPEHLVRGFEQGRRELAAAGFDRQARFARRRAVLGPLW